MENRELTKSDFMKNILVSTFSSYFPGTWFKGNGDSFLSKIDKLYCGFEHPLLDHIGFDINQRGVNKYLSHYLSAQFSLLVGLENICPDYRFRIASKDVVNPLRKESMNFLGLRDFNFFKERGKYLEVGL